MHLMFSLIIFNELESQNLFIWNWRKFHLFLFLPHYKIMKFIWQIFSLSFFNYVQDYGTLLCYGSNDLGSQTEPCVFNIIPAGKQKGDLKRFFFNFPHQCSIYIFSYFLSFVPLFLQPTHIFSLMVHIRCLYYHFITNKPSGKPDPLSNCSILNQTFDMLRIACEQGFDGGLEQNFIAEIYIHGHKNLFSSVNSKWVSSN